MNRIFRSVKRAEETIVSDVENIIDNIERDLKDLPGGSAQVQCFYSTHAILPQSQSPSQLSGWLSRIHPRYNMSSWCFFGNIEDEKGGVAAISCIVQRQNLPHSSSPYVAEWSYCDDHTNGYALAPFELPTENVAYSEPFAITADAYPLYGGMLNLSLVSGRMGQIGAQYRITGRVVDLSINFDLWEYELHLTDTMGAMQSGYGPSSFLPQWLTSEQRHAIESKFNHDVHAYLQAGQDAMTGQGCYYYSLPLLRVDSFNIRKNNQPYSSGTRGNIWVDYVVQSFSESALPLVESATWQFFAIQFPEIGAFGKDGAAMMVSIVTTTDAENRSSTLPEARFYYNGSGRTVAANGAVQASLEWKMNEIELVVTKRWQAPGGKTFPVALTLTLNSPEGTVVLNMDAIRDNQVVSEVQKYEGVFDVLATIKVNGIDESNVKGFAWAEVH